MTTTLTGETNPSPLSEAHRREMAEARQAPQRCIAAGVAAFNGWTTAAFAALSAPFSLFSVTAFIMCNGLAIVAWNEFQGRKMLQRFDPRGPRLLGWNQVGFMTLLIGYCLWSIYVGLTGPNPYEEQINAYPELGAMLGDIGEIHKTLTLTVYGGVIALTLLFQGLCARYYFARAQYVRAYLDETPAWIVDLQRS